MSVVDARQAELVAVEEFVPGARVLTELATVLDGEWFFNDERILNMAKVTKTRNVEEDLVGDSKPGKKAKVGAKAKAPKAAAKKAGPTRQAWKDTQRIKLVNKDYAPRDGSQADKVMKLLTKSATIGDYKKARKKAGLGDTVGGVLPSLVKAGHFKVI